MGPNHCFSRLANTPIKRNIRANLLPGGFGAVCFFIAYGLVSIPAGRLLQRIGYQNGIIVGLAVMGIGCLLFLPAASLRWYELFLMAYFILASGMTLLQVAANPYVTVLGDPSKSASRLNLSQAFNSLGTTLAPALGAIFILSDSVLSSDELARLDQSSKSAYFSIEAAAVQGPFSNSRTHAIFACRSYS